MLSLLAGSVVLILAAASRADAQYRFEHWDTHNGLPQISVVGITQTPDGYLWIATRDGLVRFDGTRFTVFNKTRSPGMDTNRLSTLFCDRKGRLWIGTEDGRLIEYNGGTFTSFGTVEPQRAHNAVRHVREDHEGNLWVATLRWIGRLDAQNGGSFDRVAALPGETPDPEAIPEFAYYAAGAFHRFADGRFVTIPPPSGVETQDVSVLGEDQHGRLWIATGSGALYQLTGTEFRPLRGILPFPAKSVTALLLDRGGHLWVAANHLLAVIAPDGTVRTFTPDDGLVAREIRTLHQDSEGTIWIGDAAAGLTAVRKQVFNTLAERDGLSPSNVYTVLEDRDGAVWLSTWPKGLIRYRNGQFARFGAAEGISVAPVTALYQDVNGDLLIGGYSGVEVLHPGEAPNAAAALGTPGAARFELLPYVADAFVAAIYRDERGTLWLGTSRGLVAVGADARRFTVSEGLPHNTVRAITGDRRGGLWIGTQGGIAHMSHGSIQAFTERDGLGNNYVRSLYADSDETLWVGTYDGGLTRYKGGRFTRYTTATGLFDDGVFQILDDERGNLWMSSNRGVYRVSKSDLNAFADGSISAVSSVSYGRGDGLDVEECNGGYQPAGWKSRDGRLWFPTQAGVAVVDPATLPLNPSPPPVAIEAVLIDDRPAASDAVRIPPGQHILEIQFSAPSFIRPLGIHFKYRLEGLDREWVNAGSRRSALYTRVPPGTYRFTVIAANSDGVWNVRGASLPIVIIPFFWQTWWFQSVSALFVVGVLAAAYRRRIVVLEREQAQQRAFSRQLIESQERERARVAAALHDSVGQSLLVVKNRALMAMSRPEDRTAAHAQLSEISNTASDALEEVREIANDLRPYQVDRLGLTRAIQSLLARVRDSTTLSLTAYLDDVDRVFAPDAEVCVYRIVQEGLTNVIKHAEASEASLTITRAPDCARIVIRDNGKGFSRSAVAARGGRSPGIGLMGMTERVRTLGGEQRIESGPERGTTIVIDLPVEPKNHDVTTEDAEDAAVAFEGAPDLTSASSAVLPGED